MDNYFQNIFPQKSGSQEDNQISIFGCPHSFFGRRGHADFATLNNMPSMHKIYEYGNIAIEELFVIDISEKVHNTEEMINEKISITLSFCYKTQWK